MATSRTLSVTVVSPEGAIFQGKAVAVSSWNDKGKFDILPQHANFITLIREKAILRLDSSKGKEVEFKQGILYCNNNQVEIFLGIE